MPIQFGHIGHTDPDLFRVTEHVGQLMNRSAWVGDRADLCQEYF